MYFVELTVYSVFYVVYVNTHENLISEKILIIVFIFLKRTRGSNSNQLTWDLNKIF